MCETNKTISLTETIRQHTVSLVKVAINIEIYYSFFSSFSIFECCRSNQAFRNEKKNQFSLALAEILFFLFSLFNFCIGKLYWKWMANTIYWNESQKEWNPLSNSLKFQFSFVVLHQCDNLCGRNDIFLTRQFTRIRKGFIHKPFNMHNVHNAPNISLKEKCDFDAK